MRTITLNIGTKRDNKVSDNQKTMSLEDIDRELNWLVRFFDRAQLHGVKMLPVTSDWGTEWTIVLVVDATHASINCNGENLSDIACIYFEQEAVAFKETCFRSGSQSVISGLTYHTNYPKNAVRFNFDDEYFIDA